MFSVPVPTLYLNSQNISQATPSGREWALGFYVCIFAGVRKI